MSQLNFNPETGLETPETAQLRSTVAADWVEAFSGEGLPPLNTEFSTPAGQLIDAEVAEIEAKNAEILYLSNMFNPKVAEGRWQDALGHIYFLTRKLDEPTIVTCKVTGLRGTVIPYGALVQSTDGYVLVCNRSVTIDSSNTAETTFRCSETGAIEIAAGSVTQIVTTIPGWDTVYNDSPGATGRDVETRAEFEARRAASVAANAHGSVSAIYGALADLEGVLDVQVLENINPNPVTKYGVTVPGHGITICIYGGNDADIAEVIYRKKDAGCDTGGNTEISYLAADYANAVYNYKIQRPTTVNFWVRVKLGSAEGLTPSVEAAIKQAVYQDFHGTNRISDNPRVGLATTVYASRFYKAVMAVDGIRNLHTIEIALGATVNANSYTDVIAINGTQEPVMTTNNVSIITS